MIGPLRSFNLNFNRHDSFALLSRLSVYFQKAFGVTVLINLLTKKHTTLLDTAVTVHKPTNDKQAKTAF